MRVRVLEMGESDLRIRKYACFLRTGRLAARFSVMHCAYRDAAQGTESETLERWMIVSEQEPKIPNLFRWTMIEAQTTVQNAREESIFHQPSDIRARICLSFRCNRIKERTHVRQCRMVALLCNSQ